MGESKGNKHYSMRVASANGNLISELNPFPISLHNSPGDTTIPASKTLENVSTTTNGEDAINVVVNKPDNIYQQSL